MGIGWEYWVTPNGLPTWLEETWNMPLNIGIGLETLITIWLEQGIVWPNNELSINICVALVAGMELSPCVKASLLACDYDRMGG